MDFSPLTDDQLVELIRAACAEAVNRNQAVAGAARAAMLSEAERAQVAWHAAAAEADRIKQDEARRVAEAAAEEVRRQAEARATAEAQQKQNKLWGEKKAIAQLVAGTLGPGWNLTVWRKNGDRRVYLDYGDGGYGSRNPKWCLYVTGNQFERPGKLTVERHQDVFGKGHWKTVIEEVRIICERAAAEWQELRLDVDEALRAPVPPAYEPPQEWLALKETREASEAEARAKAAEEKRREAEEKARQEAERQAKIDAALASLAPWGNIIATRGDMLLMARDGQVAVLKAGRVTLGGRDEVYQVAEADPVLAPYTTTPSDWPESILSGFRPKTGWETRGDRERLLEYALYQPVMGIHCSRYPESGWSWGQRKETTNA